MKAALITTHREFQLGAINSQTFPVASTSNKPTTWYYESGRQSADAD